MNAAKRAEIFARLQAANPAPTTELEYTSAFQLLIAVILSAQATDVSVNKATRRLFVDAPTPSAMAALGEAGHTAPQLRQTAPKMAPLCRWKLRLTLPM